MSTQPPPGMTGGVPPGLGMPPGLTFGANQYHSQQQSHAIPQQPDLSSVGPHTSSAQLAQLLASVGNGPELNPFQSVASAQSAASSQQQFGGGFQSAPIGQQQQQVSSHFGGGSHNYNDFNGPSSSSSSSNGPSSSNPCRMYQQGQCRYGASCRFQHIGPAGGNAFGNNSNFGSNFNRGASGMNSNGLNSFNQTYGAQAESMRTFPMQQPQPQQHQSDKDQLDGSSLNGFNPNANSFQPTATLNAGMNVSAPLANPNAALLQALLTQQLLNTQSGAAPNADLDRLIASLSKPVVPAVAAPILTQPSQSVSNAQTEQNLNNEFLQAQAQLASLALGGARVQQQQQQQQSQPGQQSSYNNGPSFGQRSSYSNNFPHKQHGHHSHHGGNSVNNFSNGTPQSTFHSGGNFGGNTTNSVAFGGPQTHMKFYSDPNSRDPRRELELFGPAHASTTGINFDKYDQIPVEVTGNDVPGEMKAFSDFDFPDVIRQNIELSKYVKPTPIQKYALPVAFLGRDLMACAQTGSGKTAAFLLPFIAHLVINGRPSPQGGTGRNRRYMPVGLILAPTRELATQIHEESLKFTYRTSIHSVVVYGGQDIRQQFRELDRGCDIIVGTPGRLMDFVERGRISLAQISYLCLDEADRMLDMGFEPQIRNIVLQQDMTENRQTLMFSATFPKEIQRLAQDFLYNYIFIAVGRVGASSDLITQTVTWVDEENKRNQLMQLIPQFKGLSLIFVTRKKSADLLETYLNREGYHALSIHGDRSQHERESALAQFRSGRCRILVATDVAARGLDIPHLDCVVNFDMSNTIDDYVHRIGRTGRAGNTGNAWTFVNESSSHLFKELYEMLIENKQEVPTWLSQAVESRHGVRHGGGGNRKFGGRDYRSKGSYGSHSGGRGGMAQHNMGKRFQSGGGHGGHGGHNPNMAGGNMFPSSGSSSTGNAPMFGGGGFGGQHRSNPNQGHGNFPSRSFQQGGFQ